MPTLQELFKTKKIDGNLTAEQKYDIRNSKDIPLGGAIIDKLRRSGLANRKAETRLEEELIGIRAIRGLRSPILYGTDILRLKEKTTPILSEMKLAARGTQTQDGGLVGKGLDALTGGKIKSLQDIKTKVQRKGLEIASKLGIDFPELKVPTRIVIDDEFVKASPHELNDTLTTIKKKSEGNTAGNILSSAFKSSTPNQIGNKIVGEALRVGKKVLKKTLFGSNTITFGSIQASNNIGIGKVNDVLSVYTNKDSVTALQLKDGVLPKYSSYVKREADSIKDKKDLSLVYSSRYSEIKALSINEMNLTAKTTWLNDDANSNPNGTPTFQPYSKRRGYPVGSKELGSGYELEKNIETDKGIKNNIDFINFLDVYSDPDLNTIVVDGTGKSWDSYDFVPLKFHSIAKKHTVQFRATITGLSETLSPSWDPNKTLGNPFSYYTYSGIERSVTFTFKIFSLSAKEHKKAWEKINFLTGLVYPANGLGIAGEVFITPPFLKLTLGDMFKNAEGFIESLTYNVEDTYPWEIGFSIDQTEDVENWKLPKIINVDVTYKFLDTMGDSYSINDDGTVKANRFYSFGGVGKNQALRVPVGDVNKDPDGTVKDISPLTVDAPKEKSALATDVNINFNKNNLALADEQIDSLFRAQNPNPQSNDLNSKNNAVNNAKDAMNKLFANRLRK